MDIALIIGKKNSLGVPGKNTKVILGRPCAEYAFIAAKYSNADIIFTSSDSKEIKEIGDDYGALFLERPPELATSEALTEDALTYAYTQIQGELGSKAETIETISLLFCNNPAVDVYLLKEAKSILKNKEDLDSCFSVARYDMFSPTRARRLENGIIKNFVDPSLLGEISSIRSSQGAVYFCDLSIQIMKPRCFINMDKGNLPFKWQGKKSYAVETDFGFDIDTEWQFVVIEHWLRKRGFTESKIAWEKNEH
jgi:CMP-N-acetylneuraminic acid synthetase